MQTLQTFVVAFSRTRVGHYQSLVNGTSMTLLQLRDLLSSSTRPGMRGRQVVTHGALSHLVGMTPPINPVLMPTSPLL